MYPNRIGGSLQSMADPMSTYNMGMRFVREERERRDDEDSECYSTHVKKQSPDTWVSLALEKKFAEMDRKLYRSLNESSSFSFTKFISWFTKK